MDASQLSRGLWEILCLKCDEENQAQNWVQKSREINWSIQAQYTPCHIPDDLATLILSDPSFWFSYPAAIAAEMVE